MYTYKATIKKVINRSTIMLDIDLGFKLTKKNQVYKISSINGYKCRSKPINAKYKLLSLLNIGDSVIIKSQYKRNRFSCDIINNDDYRLYHYKGSTKKIVDGDTADFNIDLGFGIYFTERFRFFGIDAWETRGDEREKGLLAKQRVIELLSEHNEIIIKTQKDSKGKYGRYLCDILVPSEKLSVCQILMNEGHALPY